ncbi:hemerythrin domain-containing protein [Nonomuraea sp. CA-218870]|uniref:hemerythrin domain-containing protein n=1 Tax=Nonomuraea sp. CA-218870 TaxID=3239998 RepID=UPI003D8E8F8D
MPYRLDMSMMLALHDALRREVERVARVAAKTGDDPRRILAAAAGWELFKKFLRVHHTTEDDVLWPAMRGAVTADGLALLDAMEDEHAAIDPLLDAVDAALVDREHGAGRLAGLVDALATGLAGHLRHEESDGLALIDATLRQEEWSRFGQAHRGRIGDDLTTYLPWLLDGRTPRVAAALLGNLPPAIREAYRDEWRPAYDRLTLY